MEKIVEEILKCSGAIQFLSCGVFVCGR